MMRLSFNAISSLLFFVGKTIAVDDTKAQQIYQNRVKSICETRGLVAFWQLFPARSV